MDMYHWEDNPADWNNSIAEHSGWRQEFRKAITNKHLLDVAEISRDDLCPMGRWLHGKARTRYPADIYQGLLKTHSLFHRESGTVAAAINSGMYNRANEMLESGTHYDHACQSMISAISAVKIYLDKRTTIYPPGVFGQGSAETMAPARGFPSQGFVIL